MTKSSISSQKGLRKWGVCIALGLAALGSLSGYWSFTISGTTKAETVATAINPPIEPEAFQPN
jgi:hypothetical protein